MCPWGVVRWEGSQPVLGKDKSFITFLDVLKVPSKHQAGAESSAVIPAGRQAAPQWLTANYTGRGGWPITYLEKMCSVQGTHCLGRQGSFWGRRGVLWLLSLNYSAGSLGRQARWSQPRVLSVFVGCRFICSSFIGITRSKVRSLFCLSL